MTIGHAGALLSGRTSDTDKRKRYAAKMTQPLGKYDAEYLLPIAELHKAYEWTRRCVSEPNMPMSALAMLENSTDSYVRCAAVVIDSEKYDDDTMIELLMRIREATGEWPVLNVHEVYEKEAVEWMQTDQTLPCPVSSEPLAKQWIMAVPCVRLTHEITGREYLAYLEAQELVKSGHIIDRDSELATRLAPLIERGVLDEEGRSQVRACTDDMFNRKGQGAFFDALLKEEVLRQSDLGLGESNMLQALSRRADASRADLMR